MKLKEFELEWPIDDDSKAFMEVSRTEKIKEDVYLDKDLDLIRDTGITSTISVEVAKDFPFQRLKLHDANGHMYTFLGTTQTSFAGSLPKSKWKVRVGSNTPLKRDPVPCLKCKNTEKNEGQEYWPEGTVSRVKAANAPEPTGVSAGSRRKKYRASAAAPKSSEMTGVVNDPVEAACSDDESEIAKDVSSEYVVYQTETEKEELSEYELDKRLGRPHPFIDPKVKKPTEEPLTSEELWWNWRKPDKGEWSRWQRRCPDVETVFVKAMAETGLEAEQERLERIGPIAYYSEWVKAWKRDTSREAVQKHYEETVWGGDPVYPTINYIHDPDEVTDFRGPDFHEPTPDMIDYLKEHGKMIPREELDKVRAKEKKTDDVEQLADMDEAMAKAVDIGVKDDEGEDSEVESNDEEEKINRNWSVLKSTPELRKSKGKPKKDAISIEEAIDDSENLTDFILDFDEEE
ncbi:hypothetical protein LguiA_024953 [Lonicera macranthoides]